MGKFFIAQIAPQFLQTNSQYEPPRTTMKSMLKLFIFLCISNFGVFANSETDETPRTEGLGSAAISSPVCSLAESRRVDPTWFDSVRQWYVPLGNRLEPSPARSSASPRKQREDRDRLDPKNVNRRCWSTTVLTSDGRHSHVPAVCTFAAKREDQHCVWKSEETKLWRIRLTGDYSLTKTDNSTYVVAVSENCNLVGQPKKSFFVFSTLRKLPANVSAEILAHVKELGFRAEPNDLSNIRSDPNYFYKVRRTKCRARDFPAYDDNIDYEHEDTENGDYSDRQPTIVRNRGHRNRVSRRNRNRNRHRGGIGRHGRGRGRMGGARGGGASIGSYEDDERDDDADNDVDKDDDRDDKDDIFGQKTETRSEFGGGGGEVSNNGANASTTRYDRYGEDNKGDTFGQKNETRSEFGGAEVSNIGNESTSTTRYDLSGDDDKGDDDGVNRGLLNSLVDLLRKSLSGRTEGGVDKN